MKIENDIFNSFGKRYKMHQLKSKFNRLRKAHREFSHLLEQTGMGWDPQTSTVTTDDEVWDTYLKVIYLHYTCVVDYLIILNSCL